VCCEMSVREYGTLVTIPQSTVRLRASSDDEVVSPERANEALLRSRRSVGFSGAWEFFPGAPPSAEHVGPH
jgi:hypothetical protein